MNKKRVTTKKKATKPGDAKIKLGVAVTGNPKLNKPKKKSTK